MRAEEERGASESRRRVNWEMRVSRWEVLVTDSSYEREQEGWRKVRGAYAEDSLSQRAHLSWIRFASARLLALQVCWELAHIENMCGRGILS